MKSAGYFLLIVVMLSAVGISCSSDDPAEPSSRGSFNGTWQSRVIINDGVLISDKTTKITFESDGTASVICAALDTTTLDTVGWTTDNGTLKMTGDDYCLLSQEWSYSVDSNVLTLIGAVGEGGTEDVIVLERFVAETALLSGLWISTNCMGGPRHDEKALLLSSDHSGTLVDVDFDFHPPLTSAQVSLLVTFTWQMKDAILTITSADSMMNWPYLLEDSVLTIVDYRQDDPAKPYKVYSAREMDLNGALFGPELCLGVPFDIGTREYAGLSHESYKIGPTETASIGLRMARTVDCPLATTVVIKLD